MKNLEIAHILYEIADFLEMKEVPFKPRAYRRAAITIENLSEDVEEIYRKEGIKGLDKIPGVGKGIAEKIAEFLKTGRLKYYKALKKKLPVEISELMSVSGLGPKTIELLYQKLKIKNLADLKKAAKQHKIRKVAGLGEAVEKNILKGVEIKKEIKGRMLLGSVMPLAEEMKSKLASLKNVKKVEIAGSYRRAKETIGDLDILVISDKAGAVINHFCSLPEVERVVAKGMMKCSVKLQNSLGVDLYVLPEKKFGSALQYFTGSKEHSIEVRKIALKKSYTLSEHGLFKVSGKKWVAGLREEDIYKKLGMQYIPPEMRENLGEIELALKHKLPKVVGRKDIKGDFHCHTKWSDGDNAIEQMALEAQKLGFKFIAITDHAGPLKIARALDDKRMKSYLKAIDKAQKKVKIKIFKGAEVDILKNGSLALKESTLKELDIVLAAVHSSFRMADVTGRVCRAMENYPINVLSHPTSRLIGEREGCKLNFRKVFETAKRTGTFLEVDVHTNRLDLNDVNIRKAIEMGCKLSLGSDSHNKGQIHLVRDLGIPWVRRGWATPKDILNCWSLSKIEKALRK